MIQEFVPPPIENVEFAYSFQRFLPFLPFSEVNLTESYPNIKVHGNTPHETSRHCNITSTPRVMEYCWNNNHNFVYDHCNDAYFKKLLNSDTVPPLIKKFLQKYRLDIYGNVISQTSSKNSLVGFDVDHKFPYSRGGRSTNKNFICCQSTANRHVKSDQLIPYLDAKAMACGLQLDQLLGIVKYCHESQQGKGRGTLSHLLTTFEKFLEADPPNIIKSKAKATKEKSNSWFCFQKETKGSTEGAFLLAYFRYKVEKQLCMLGKADESKLGQMPDPEDRSTFDFEKKKDVKDVKDFVSGPVVELLSKPTIYLSKNMVDERIEVYGYNHIRLMEGLRREFDMSWDYSKECWWTYVQYWPVDDIELYYLGLKIYLESSQALTVVEQGDEEDIITEALAFPLDSFPSSTSNPKFVEITPSKPIVSAIPLTNKGIPCKNCLKKVVGQLCWRHDPERET